MPRAVWTGSIGFGLVNIPVRLFNATAPADVRFHEFDRETGRRVRHRRVAADEGFEAARWPESSTGGGGGAEDWGAELPRPQRGPSERPDVGPAAQAQAREDVPYQDVVKGYEVSPGRFVMLTSEELRALQPERSRVIEVQDFVSLDQVDPVYFDRSYYVAPARGVGAEKSYALLLRALQRSRRAGIGSFVLTSRLRLAAVRPREDVLVLETLFYGDEVRSAAELDSPPVLVEPSDRELDVAVRLIDLLASEWDPARYRDEYRERVLELIGSKAPEARAVEPETAQAQTGVGGLMAALQASVEAARKGSTRSARPRSRRRTG